MNQVLDILLIIRVISVNFYNSVMKGYFRDEETETEKLSNLYKVKF